MSGCTTSAPRRVRPRPPVGAAASGARRRPAAGRTAGGRLDVFAVDLAVLEVPEAMASVRKVALVLDDAQCSTGRPAGCSVSRRAAWQPTV
jgi:hypothetical protein